MSLGYWHLRSTSAPLPGCAIVLAAPSTPVLRNRDPHRRQPAAPDVPAAHATLARCDEEATFISLAEHLIDIVGPAHCAI